MGRDLIIVVKGNSKGLDPTIKKMQLLGTIDKKNAEQFEKNQTKYRSLVAKQVGTLEKLRIKQQKIIDLREKSTNPKRIQRYNSMLKKTTSQINKVTGATNKQVSSMNMLQSSIATIGATMLAAFSVQAIISYASELKKLSIQMEADNKKNAIVFGDSLDSVTASAKENANAIGLTTNEYIRASASTQDLLVPLGFVRKEASKMSTDLTELSGALSVWSGGTRSATEVSEILTKTILGETEQIKTLGIKIDQTSPAFNKRIKETMEATGQSLEQVKALEILNQITTKSVDAQTSFASGQKTLAQETAEANAQLRQQEELIAEKSVRIWRALNKLQFEYIEDLSRGIEKTGEFWDLLMQTTDLNTNIWSAMASESEKASSESAKSFSFLTEKINFTKFASKEVLELFKEINSKKPIENETIKSFETLGGLGKKLAKARQDLLAVATTSSDFKRLNQEIKETEARIKQLTTTAVAEVGETILQKLTKEASALKNELMLQSLAGEISDETMMQYTTTIEVLTEAQNNLNKAIGEEKEKREGLLEFIKSEALPLMEENDESEVLLWNKKEQKFTTISEQESQKRIDIRKAEYNAVQDGLVSSVFRMEGVLKAHTEYQLAQVQAKIDRNEITEAEGEKRIAEIRRTSATHEKTFKMFSIITSTAQAVANALANIPAPYNIAVAGTMGVLGAAELALVAGTPIPEFAKGTKGKQGSGMAIVGEEGEEAVFLPHGPKVLPAGQTKQYGDIIDAMYDNRLDAHLMKNYVPRMLPKQQTQGSKDNGFIDKMIHGLGTNDFNTDPVVNALKKMDKNDNTRMELLAGVILKGMNKRPNLRN